MGGGDLRVERRGYFWLFSFIRISESERRKGIGVKRDGRARMLEG